MLYILQSHAYPLFPIRIPYDQCLFWNTLPLPKSIFFNVSLQVACNHLFSKITVYRKEMLKLFVLSCCNFIKLLLYLPFCSQYFQAVGPFITYRELLSSYADTCIQTEIEFISANNKKICIGFFWHIESYVLKACLFEDHFIYCGEFGKVTIRARYVESI